jgi:ERCC4-related helicase
MKPYSIYQSKLWATKLTLKEPSDSIGKIGRAITTAKVDLNPHQVDAALFASRSPLSKGVILADEVGLGKTIEAGIVISQKWAERNRNILIITPATLRKQWQQELSDKFNLKSLILDKKIFDNLKKDNKIFNTKKIIICSYNFAASKFKEIAADNWDLVVIDEAHRLRNVFKPKNVIASLINKSVKESVKLLLTATPLQNSLLELYGLVSIIDPHVFGDINSFKEQYVRNSNFSLRNSKLKERIKPFCQRTLRKQVKEYIKFTERIALTEEYIPSHEEHKLYELVSSYLQRPKLNALPSGQRILMTIVLRKLLASSSYAIAATLDKLAKKLEKTEKQQNIIDIFCDEIDDLDEITDEIGEEKNNFHPVKMSKEQLEDLKLEIQEIKSYAKLANNIQNNSKGTALLKVLKTAFKKIENIGAKRKAVIFTESRRTQEYLFKLLNDNDFKDKVCLINGSNDDLKSKQIYNEWIIKNKDTDKISGSKSADMKAALIDYFKEHATILIATEAAAEGVNLQFCSLVINYDLPWNPQRVEQRIGRCHRYGQKYDVVVVNFLNKKNVVDQRVFQLLSEKFKLFDGVFGASDEILGAIESGIDIEVRIANVYQNCRTAEQIQTAFDEIQSELDDQIKLSLENARLKLLENFDEEVNSRLKINKDQTQTLLDKRGRILLMLAKTELKEYGEFNELNEFHLKNIPPGQDIEKGFYNFDWRKAEEKKQHFFSENSLLTDWLIKKAINRNTKEISEIELNYKAYPFKISALEKFRGKTGWVRADKVTISSVEDEEFIAISALTDDGIAIDQELAQSLLLINCNYVKLINNFLIPDTLDKNMNLEVNNINTMLDNRNSRYFDEETVKLDNWADDLKFGLESEIKEADKQIREFKKESKVAASLAQKLDLQKKLKNLENSRNNKRKNLYQAQDEIDKNRDKLIKKVEKQLKCSFKNENLFVVRWSLK